MGARSVGPECRACPERTRSKGCSHVGLPLSYNASRSKKDRDPHISHSTQA